MKVSLKELVVLIKETIAAKMPEIVSFDFLPPDLNNTVRKEFPKVYFYTQEAFTLQENTNIVPLYFRFCDVMYGANNAWERDLEIKSDMLQAASKLFDLVEFQEVITGRINVSALPFDNDLNNGISGVECTVNFILEKPSHLV